MLSLHRRTRLSSGVPALALLLALVACAPKISVQSNLDPDYRVDIDRVFVVIDTRQVDEASRKIVGDGGEFAAEKRDTLSFNTYFLPALRERFALANVEVDGHVISGLELSPTEITDAIVEYAPDAVLRVKEAWFLVRKDPGLMGLGKSQEVTAIDLDAMIFEPGVDEAKWRALLEIESGQGGLPKMAEVLADNLVLKLLADGLIDPDARAKKTDKNMI